MVYVPQEKPAFYQTKTGLYTIIFVTSILSTIFSVYVSTLTRNALGATPTVSEVKAESEPEPADPIPTTTPTIEDATPLYVEEYPEDRFPIDKD